MGDTRRTLFRGALLIDGTGTEPRSAEVLVDGDTIIDIGSHLDSDGADIVELRGLALAPGFIDMHSHSDVQLLADPAHEAKLTQGVTLEVLGQDGLSYAPVDEAALRDLRSRIRGWNDDPAGFDWNWRTVADYLALLDGRVAVNTAYLVPHGTLRLIVMGTEDRPPTAEEFSQMKSLLARGMREGAVGMSAGLGYVPGSYAATDELVELCEVVAAHGGYFCPHHRNYGSAALDGYRECVDIARRSGVALHFAHAHLSFEVNRGRMPQLLALFDEAIAEGVDLSFDSYPYLAGMTTLVSQLPSWAQSGSAQEQLDRLADADQRRRIIEALDVTGSDGHQGLTVDWSQIHVVGTPDAPHFEWVTSLDLAAAAARVGTTPAELCLDLLVATRLGAPCVIFIGIEEHVRSLMQHPRHMVGSDGILVGERPHPRAWGTFPRVLGEYVREAGVLSLAEAVRHMTSSPAARIGLEDRGRIAVGFKGDLVAFDPGSIAERASYSSPKQRSRGIIHVMVNGVFAVRDGRLTGAHAGRVVGGRRG